MTAEDTIPILARWIRELTWQQHTNQRTITTLQTQVQRLEHATRQRALARRHFIRNGHKDRV